MKWLIFLALAFVFVVQITSVIPIVEASPKYKTRIRGTKRISQPSTQKLMIGLTLQYQKSFLRYRPLTGKKITFFLMDTKNNKLPKEVGSQVTDHNGKILFTTYKPPVNFQQTLKAKFAGDVDFNPCEFLLRIKRLNVRPEVKVSTVQIDNKKVRLAWEGTDFDGDVEFYNYILDRPWKNDDWSGWTKTTNTIYELKPGKYTFKVQARDNFLGKSKIYSHKFVVEKKVIQLKVMDEKGNQPPFIVKKGVPLNLNAILEEDSKKKEFKANWHCYQGTFTEGQYQCLVGGVEDLVILEDSESGKLIFFKIKVEN